MGYEIISHLFYVADWLLPIIKMLQLLSIYFYEFLLPLSGTVLFVDILCVSPILVSLYLHVRFLHLHFFKWCSQDFRHEVNLLVKLRHPNIVQFLGAVTDRKPLMLITEFLRGVIKEFAYFLHTCFCVIGFQHGSEDILYQMSSHIFSL